MYLGSLFIDGCENDLSQQQYRFLVFIAMNRVVVLSMINYMSVMQIEFFADEMVYWGKRIKSVVMY